jgi:hypothetical protein
MRFSGKYDGDAISMKANRSRRSLQVRQIVCGEPEHRQNVSAFLQDPEEKTFS